MSDNENPRTKLTIVYRSGATIDFTCDEFFIKWSASTGKAISFKGQGMQPTPLMIGLEDIAAVWEERA